MRRAGFGREKAVHRDSCSGKPLSHLSHSQPHLLHLYTFQLEHADPHKSIWEATLWVVAWPEAPG